MLYFALTVILTLMVFILRLPVTIRRVKAQREALRPARPITRADHLPCILNTIGAVLTEFFQLGLLSFAVFVGANAAFSAFEHAPDIITGLRQISLGALALMALLTAIIVILAIGGATACYALAFLSLFVIIAWMARSSVGDEWPAVVIFALFTIGAPSLLISLIRRLF